MEIRATVTSSPGKHRAHLKSGNVEHTLKVLPKGSLGGSGTTGGEFLMLALATCYCNDLYREAARLGIALDEVFVEALADFEGLGLAASNIRYRAEIHSSASEEEVRRLMILTDAVAEVHNTVRRGGEVRLITDEQKRPQGCGEGLWA